MLAAACIARASRLRWAWTWRHALAGALRQMVTVHDWVAGKSKLRKWTTMKVTAHTAIAVCELGMGWEPPPGRCA